MAFTYTTLKLAVQDYTQNTNWGTSGQFDVIVQQAEERINLAVNVTNYNTKSVDGALSDQTSNVVISGSGPGVAEGNVTSPITPLYMKIRAGSATGDSETPWQYLLLKDYNFLQEYAPVTHDTTDGTPKYYSFYNDTTNSGLATFAFAPRTDGNYTYEILYLFQPPSVTLPDYNSGTWLSTHGSSALLYGCLVEAYTFMKGEPDLIQLYDAKFKEALQVLIASQGGSFRNATYRDQALRGAA